MTPDDMIAQDRIYARSLAVFDPLVVEAACDEWSTTKQFWPELKELLAMCREHERLAEVARRPRLAPPPANEARPRVQRTDEEILGIWAENDRLGAELNENPTAYCCGAELAKVFRGFRAKRFEERPDLAERYYALRAAE